MPRKNTLTEIQRIATMAVRAAAALSSADPKWLESTLKEIEISLSVIRQNTSR